MDWPREQRDWCGGMVSALKNERDFHCQMQIPPGSKTIAWIIGHARRWTPLVPMARYRSNGGEVADTTWADACSRNECFIEWFHDRSDEGRRQDGIVDLRFLPAGEYTVVAHGEAITARTIRRRSESERSTGHGTDLHKGKSWQFDC